jgi:biotin carboxylase
MPWVFASPKPFDGSHPHRGDMAHLLIIELPGGDDTDLLIAAITRGDEFTFLSAQLDHYRNQPAVWSLLEAARELIDVPGFDDIEVMRRVLDVHARRRIDAVLCLLDIRLVEAARLAEKLNVRHISPATARLLRDKVSVRRRLAERGIAQPTFELAESNAQLQAAVQRLGLPVLIKPADGYGSQNIVVLRHAQDLDPLLTPLTQMLPSRADYGLGVVANDRLLVERYLSGTFFGCDTLSVDGRHTIVGLHQKVMFEPPSFAMRGSTFVPHSMPNANASMIERYVVSLLDAVGFNWGAAHTELMLTAEGLHVIEINPRLVGAKIARLVSHSLGQSQHARLIAAHLGVQPTEPEPSDALVGVIRWIVAAQPGVLEAVRLPQWNDPRIRCVEVLKRPGDPVWPPFENADRIGYVMVCGADREEAERIADRVVAEATVVLKTEVQASTIEPTLRVHLQVLRS